MNGQSEFYVQPSTLVLPAGFAANQWYRGVPTPGVPITPGIPAVAGIPDCKNLAASSPPTLLCEYQLYSYSIGWNVAFANSAAFAPNVMIELALLINDRVRYVLNEGVTFPAGLDGAGGIARAFGTWVSDLVNPIKLGARDRLSLRVGVLSDSQADLLGVLLVAAQLDSAAHPIGYESTISYNVIDLPGSRRL